MSGASGAIPAALHVTPESVQGGPIARLRDGDLVRLDAANGRLDVLVDESEWLSRVAAPPSEQDHHGTGRELFSAMRRAVGRADEGAHVFGALARPAQPSQSLTTDLQESAR
jgi:phosphogluconate dehydratase